MANTSGDGTSWNLPNYIGTIYLVGSDNKTPFLNMMGGLEGGSVRLVGDQQFAVSQPWDLATGSSATISESESLTAPTAYQYVRDVKYNTTQIVQKQVSVSYVKMSVGGQITADTTTNLIDASEWSPAQNELDFQINANLKQIAKDLEYSCFKGVYNQADSATEPAATRGMEAVAAITGSTSVAAGGVDLSKDLINELLRGMLSKGAEFENPVLFCNAFQKQQISNEYGYEPESRTVGGVNIQQIMTDFCMLGVAYSPQITTSTIVIADMAVCHPVWLPVPGKGILFYEELSKTGAAETGQIFGQFGLDYGPYQAHGSVTNLAIS